ncbi:hypothetical protein BDR06DRAFT_347066 [Suillus hirtellus]|nr:hypothetical protein BDR06DRAFT_347066 [Suillus hirtellus]
MIAHVFCHQTTGALVILCRVCLTLRSTHHISLPCASVIELYTRGESLLRLNSYRRIVLEARRCCRRHDLSDSGQRWVGSSSDTRKCLHKPNFKYTLKHHGQNKYDGSSTRYLLHAEHSATISYTVLLVGTCTRSWKTIEFMIVSVSYLATSLA